MAEKIHSKEAGKNHKQEVKAEQAPLRNQPDNGLGQLLMAADLLGEASNDQIAARSKQLNRGRLQLVQRQALAKVYGQRQGNQQLSRRIQAQPQGENKEGGEEKKEKRYNITLSTGTRNNLTEGEALGVLNESYDSIQRNLEFYEGEHKMIKANRDSDAFIGVGGFLTDLFGEDFPDVAMWDEPRQHLVRARSALWTKNIEGAGNELTAAATSFQKCKEKWTGYKDQLPNAGAKAQIGVVVIAVVAVVVILATGGAAGAGATGGGGTATGGGATAGGGAAAAGGVAVGGGVTTAAATATTLPGVSLVNMLITEVGGALAAGNAGRALAVLSAYASTPSGRNTLLKCGQVVIAHMQQPGLTRGEFQMLKQVADSFFQFARGG